MSLVSIGFTRPEWLTILRALAHTQDSICAARDRDDLGLHAPVLEAELLAIDAIRITINGRV